MDEDNSSAFATDSASQLDVLGHDSHALGVDGAKIRILEQTDQVGLGRFLQTEEDHRNKLESLRRGKTSQYYTREPRMLYLQGADGR